MSMALETMNQTIAYFCMEVGLGDLNVPTYGGGLGVLAGDTLHSAADLGVPMVGVSLLYRRGYFRQRLDAEGNQTESPETWDPRLVLERLPIETVLTIEGRSVQVGVWRHRIRGISGHAVPVYFLDTTLPGNDPEAQSLTGQLYGGDTRYRLCQEAVLGLGGVAMLRELGHDQIRTYHLNEGHSALLALALLAEKMGARGIGSLRESDIEAVRRRCVFTTHTPVPAAMDHYDWDLVQRVLGAERAAALQRADCRQDGRLNMTLMALRFSHYVNGVAMRHGEVSRGLFPHYPINSITNGVHAVNWTAPPFAEVFDARLPEWRRDNLYLRYAISIPLAEVRAAHAACKAQLLACVRERTGERLDPGVFTLGCARRATPYKRANLILSNPERLAAIARRYGGLQLIFAGKAHPADEGGKAIIRQIFRTAKELPDLVRVVYLENYDLPLARKLVSGSDLWLNTPLPPNEASGTSGMKAALNGVPSLSTLDGWWIEGHAEGITGWAIGDDRGRPNDALDAASLHDQLDRVILPLYHGHSDGYVAIRRATIALNGSFFNTHRMLAQYIVNAYSQDRSAAPGDNGHVTPYSTIQPA